MLSPELLENWLAARKPLTERKTQGRDEQHRLNSYHKKSKPEMEKGTLEHRVV